MNKIEEKITTRMAVVVMLTALLLSACGSSDETPQLGAATSAPTAVVAATFTAPAQAPTNPPAPSDTPVPATPGLPEGAILLPTLPRPATQALASTPIPLYPEGALAATLTVLPPATPDVAIYSAVWQAYQGGAMLYIAEFREIWVLVQTPGKRGGPYYRFVDNFAEGDTEEIANLPVPPGLLQPHRGFGRIWREQPGLRAQVGWATNYELPFTMRGAYVVSGGFDALGNFAAGAGMWMFTLHDNSIGYFNEATNTWGIASNQ